MQKNDTQDLIIPKNVFQLTKEILSVFIKNFFPIVFIVLLIGVPVEGIKNYFFGPWDNGESRGVFSKHDGLVAIVFLSLITPTIIYYLFQHYIGAKKSILKSIVLGLKTWPKIIGYGFLKNIIIIAGFICLIIPGIIFIYRLFFMFVIITLEGTKGNDPVGASRIMSEGIMWKLIFCSILITVIIAIPLLTVVFLTYYFLDGWIVDTILDLNFELWVTLYTVISVHFYMLIKNKAKQTEGDLV